MNTATRNLTYFVVLPGVLFLLGVASRALADNPAPSSTTDNSATASPVPEKFVAFHPPGGVSDGILPNRVGGGSRGGSLHGLSLKVLVPEQVAETTQARPTLYWYQNQATSYTCEFTLSEWKKSPPVLKRKITGVVPAGMHFLRLSACLVDGKPVTLQTGKDYQWTVAMVSDPQNRSLDIIASGVVKRVDAPADLAAALATAKPTEKAALFATHGYWIDALQAISDQIATQPGNLALQEQRNQWLQEVGLDPLTVASNAH